MLRQTITRLISSSEAGLLTQGPTILDQIASRNTVGASIAARTQALFSTSSSVASAASVGTSDETINVTFTDDKDGSIKTVKVPLGENLLEAAHKNDIDLEGACEGSLACSTCHVIVEDEAFFERMPEADDDENDMLDLAFGLTDTSRLGCQVKAAKELDGLKVRIPSATRNFAVDGHVPKPH